MKARANAPIIIKRKKIIAGGGHHGGAWKVAYADFVTIVVLAGGATIPSSDVTALRDVSP